MMTRAILAATGLAVLAACSSEGPVRYRVPSQPGPEAPIPVAFRSVEVREAELPLYAQLEPISVEVAPGVLTSDDNVLWAEDPQRAVTQGVATALARSTRITVAAEPWPFDDFPEARLDIRVEQIVGGSDGIFRLAGQYFVSDREGRGRDRAAEFGITVPFNPEDPASIGRAQGQAITELAQTIARDSL